MTEAKVMTIQDISCYGQCSLTVALPIISACGIETAILPSAVLSTHTGGFMNFTFRDLTDDIPKIMEHWMREGIKFDCIYTGYLGSLTQIEYVKALFKNVLKEGGLKIVDPAMADNGKLYYGFDTDFAHAMAGLCGEADIILPNITEACFMCDKEFIPKHHTQEYIDDLLTALNDLGARKIVLKGVSYEESKLGIVVYDTETDEKMEYFNEKVDWMSHGTGDCYAAAFTGAILQGMSLYDAAALAADFVVEALRFTKGDENHKYGVKFEKALPMLVERLNK
ncbi:MAG: pyridoxine kinase [Epulopiscium sp.]|jgi:pyridoxine kinase|uniref:pyridoxal kinase n=1 Tax=Defluviitalea raffinosedens TaxID=1450156 RepID=A0A7C8HDF9_9FIRM|nr:pyridoxamine kinase [Defluviitalea raffinosedens]KAE9630658.1 pyridoxamine kinase [Defluviitalea raffinosedens]MBZ4667143.1 pyridoxamine kinase [Defluviitaleaceae bacterium]MDK2789159.1 pyridoxine kinase [Candidatus Epulonipiscium sp.]HHW67809.1 pyridoxamine kinase [Candidatus Epulonipiscium sp.]